MKKKYKGRGRKKRDEDYKAPGRRSICAKALMRLRPGRWSSTSSVRNVLQQPYRFQLTISPSSSVECSRFRCAIIRSLDGKSRLQPVDTRIIHLRPPIPIRNSPSSVHISIFVLNGRTMCSAKISSYFFPACTYSSGLVTLAMPGLSCWGVVVSVPRSERVTSMRIRSLTVLQRRPRLENRRKEIRDAG